MSVETSSPVTPSPDTRQSKEPHVDVNLSGSIRDYWDRVRGGDIGAIPAVLGIVALVVVFSSVRPETFPTRFNFANLLSQSAAVIVISMGLVFVLLLGEIDLSAGYGAGTSAAIMGVTLTNHGWPWFLSVLVCLVTGVAIGSTIGVLVARVRIPSFVVTLSFFLGLQGVLLLVIGDGGTIAIRDSAILSIMNKNMSIVAGWALFFLVVGGFAVTTFLSRRARARIGLPIQSAGVALAKTGALAIVFGIPTALLSQERSLHPENVSIKGVPNVVLVILVLLVGLTFLLQRTAVGRHIYAVGGNAEAARRAGINVRGVRMLCFIICSTMASIAGVLLASRDNSISPSSGGSTTLLYAVGAAVIGGTSLFGGHGKVRDAILGGLVVAIIDNGMVQLKQPAGRVFIVTALVLLVAASVDAISRRRAASSGR